MPEDQALNITEGKPIPTDLGSKAGIEKEPPSENDIVIYTIPKRFLAVTKPSKRAKSIGFLILIGGAIILSVGVAYLYFYITNTELSFLSGRNVKTNEETNLEENQSADLVKEAETSKKATSSDLNFAPNLTDKENINQPSASGSPTAVPETGDKESSGSSTSSDEQITAATSSPTSATSSPPTPVNFIYPDDNDADGLFNSEESLIGSKDISSDSDSDGYEDLVELLKLYNPAGEGRLLTNDNIRKYTNGQYDYSLYYPYLWQFKKVGGDESIAFITGDNQMIQVITADRDKSKTLSDWYKENTGTAFLNNDQIFYKVGWEGVKSQDGLNIYLTKPNLNFIIILVYNLGADNILNYKNIFEMMINSLEINN